MIQFLWSNNVYDMCIHYTIQSYLVECPYNVFAFIINLTSGFKVQCSHATCIHSSIQNNVKIAWHAQWVTNQLISLRNITIFIHNSVIPNIVKWNTYMAFYALLIWWLKIHFIDIRLPINGIRLNEIKPHWHKKFQYLFLCIYN